MVELKMIVHDFFGHVDNDVTSLTYLRREKDGHACGL